MKVRVFVVLSLVPVQGVPSNQVDGVDVERQLHVHFGDIGDQVLLGRQQLVDDSHQFAIAFDQRLVKQYCFADSLYSSQDGLRDVLQLIPLLVDGYPNSILQVNDSLHHHPEVDFKLDVRVDFAQRNNHQHLGPMHRSFIEAHRMQGKASRQKLGLAFFEAVALFLHSRPHLDVD